MINVDIWHTENDEQTDYTIFYVIFIRLKFNTWKKTKTNIVNLDESQTVFSKCQSFHFPTVDNGKNGK